jgi:hypothetical protein
VLTAGVFRLDGSIVANGTSGGAGGGGNAGAGGSGGSIWIVANTLIGVGSMYAVGGDGTRALGNSQYSGGGGGGRIAVWVINAPFFTPGAYRGTYNVSGGASGTGGNPGSPGTVYFNFKSRGTVLSTW